MTAGDPLLRIGELSRRTGVSRELLRAWELRYGLLRPARSAGGLRLYSAADVERVRLMREHLATGLAAAEAARLARGEDAAAVPATSPALVPRGAREELADALENFDEARAQALVDRLLATTTVDSMLTDVVLPYLRDLGERWSRGEVSVAQEHFASTVLRGRLLGLARGWGLGLGPVALLACLPGEEHDLGLIAFGLALRARGWCVVFLGGSTPLDTVAGAAARVDPAFVVLSAVAAERARPVAGELEALAAQRRVALGGSAAGAPELEGKGMHLLTGDVIAEATNLTALAQEPAPTLSAG